MFVQLSEVSGQAVSCSSCGATSVIRFIMSRADQSMGARTGGSTIVRPITACSRVLGYARHRVVTRALFRPGGHSTLQDSHG
jgi:pyruvate/2-oxoacid:ferredoxin oxidoreductase beta subunit